MSASPSPAPTATDSDKPLASPAPSSPAPAKAKKDAPGKAGPRAALDKKPPSVPKPAAKKTARKATRVATAPTAAPAPAPAKKATANWPTAPAKKAKPPAVAAKPKAKLVRDSFTMPQADFGLIATLKDRALGFKRPTKKSELLRAGLQVLAALPVDGLKATLERLAPLKTGRPKKND